MLVTVSVNVIEEKFPGGTVGGDWRIECALANAPADVAFEYEGAAASTTFDMPEGETYVIRAVRLDAAGVALGPIANTQYTVGEDLVPIDVANSISAVATPGTKVASESKRDSRK